MPLLVDGIPAAFEAEQGLLGCLIQWPDRTLAAAEMIEPAHFADPLHGRIWEAACRIANAGQLVSPLGMRAYLDSLPEAEPAGGGKYIARMVAASGEIVDIREAALLVRDLYIRRQILELSATASQMARFAEKSAHETVAELEASLYRLAAGSALEPGFQPLATALAGAVRQAEAAFQRDGKLSGVPSGLADLDALVGGFSPGDLVIVAGRPAMGKTALGLGMAVSAARAGHPAGFFSLEMAAEQVSTRILAAEAKVPSDRIRRGDINGQELDRLLEASTRLESLHLWIDDSPARNLAGLRGAARRLARQHGLGLVIVDYLQLVSSSRRDGRVQEVSEISRGLKTIAKEIAVPIVALSQLSREVERRENRKPQLADLRDSGSIEQDADVVIFIYRDDYYLAREEPVRKDSETDGKFSERMLRWNDARARAAGRAELIVAKHRHGPIGSVSVAFDAALTRFSDIPDAARD